MDNATEWMSGYSSRDEAAQTQEELKRLRHQVSELTIENSRLKRELEAERNRPVPCDWDRGVF